MASSAVSDNKAKMARGELYYAFTPELVAERARCQRAIRQYSDAVAADASRREVTQLWKQVVNDDSPAPSKLASADEDSSQFEDEPIVQPPVFIDYGYNVKLGSNVFVNAYSTWIDTCTISVGARTLMGPHVSIYSGTHPLDPKLRNGTRGPELGKEVHIGQDCWIGGNVTILPGVTIGEGSTVGAASVVTKDVPPFHVVAGNPARVIRKIETEADTANHD